MKRQGLIITTGQLHKLIEDLEKEHTEWEDGTGFFDEERKFQVNIINKKGLSDTWKIEDTIQEDSK